MADKEAARANTPKIIGEVAVFCTLSLLGTVLFILIALTSLDWFYPTLFYGGLVYFAVQRYFVFGQESEVGSSEYITQKDSAQANTVQVYLDRMTNLLLRERLREQPPNSEAHRIGRTLTLMVLQELDGPHKRSIIWFLYESDLITKEQNSVSESGLIVTRQPVVDLRKADLSGAHLSQTSLIDANLNEANLVGADLRYANLFEADLRNANLFNANLNGTDLFEADLSGANLRGAHLNGTDLGNANLNEADLFNANLNEANLIGAGLLDANLREANLVEADLRGADLRGADLSEADLSGADLSGADLGDAAFSITEENLEAQAASLQGAIMPNGQKYEDWLDDHWSY